MNVGYWAPFCETWFERWNAQILAGADPKTAGQWANALRYNFKETSQLVRSTEMDSSEYILSCLNTLL